MDVDFCLAVFPDFQNICVSDRVRTPRHGYCRAPRGEASGASRKVQPMKLVRDTKHEFRAVKPIISMNSKLEGNEDGLHINFD